MIKKYLKQAPTLIVIGVTGFMAWPALFPEGDSAPPKVEPKPPSVAKASPTVSAESTRDPFLIARPMVAATKASEANHPAKAERTTPAKGSALLPDLSANEDQILEEMKLVGTFIDGREQIAIIDGKVYSRGEQLRKADGSKLPYVVHEVRNDRALLRRGRRDFVMKFSDVPRSATTKADTPAVARSETPARAKAQAQPPTQTASRKKAGPNSTRPGDDTNPTSMLLKLLSSGGGAPGGSGGGSASSALAGLGDSSGSSAGSSNVPINPTTIQAGIDALMGKFDNIGRGDASGGTTP